VSDSVLDRFNYRLPRQIPLEYRIIEKTLLTCIHFRLGTNLYEYLATSNCDISVVINRLIDDHDLKLTSPDLRLCFFNELGMCLESGMIGDIYRTNGNMTINITVREEGNTDGTLCEVTRRLKQGKHHTVFMICDCLCIGQDKTSMFHPTTKWQQIDFWVKTILPETDQPIDDCVY
jgi:hypothetical protein